MPEPRFRFIEHIAVWEWGPEAESGGPIVLFCHATGFHARCWNHIISMLPADVQSIALDMRGHGRSGNPEGPLLWKNFGEDVALVIDSLGLDDIFGVGHSMGGHSLVHAATLRPLAFRSLLLLDPVIRPVGAYGKPWVESHYARKRRNEFASADEMFERFKDKLPFSAWDPNVLRDYCDGALRGNVLACEPAFEGAVYENSSVTASDLGEEIGSVAVPVTVMRSHLKLAPGATDMNGSPTDPKLASRFQRGTDIEVPHGHFFPMEAPALVAEQIRLQL